MNRLNERIGTQILNSQQKVHNIKIRHSDKFSGTKWKQFQHLSIFLKM